MESAAIINNNGTPGDITDDFVDYTPTGLYFGVETFTIKFVMMEHPSLCVLLEQ
ncbi:MAG: hypothetical protein R2728_02695 [Chitinophagales bacterium]